jgi:phosphoribosylaminoimidazole-succinocarboxamide synthase
VLQEHIVLWRTYVKTRSEPVASGKTKDIFPIHVVRVVSRNDITAGNGAMHDSIPNKGVLSTETTANVFTLLEAFGVETAFIKKEPWNSFLAHACSMLPFEVVARIEAHGSALKRNPKLVRGQRFDKTLLELYLKTSTKRFMNLALPVDDMLLRFYKDEALLHHPDMPYKPKEPSFRIGKDAFFRGCERNMTHPVSVDLTVINQALATTKRVARILEVAWGELGYQLCDFKLEFGISREGKLLLADVVDNDSWRLIDRKTGEYVDKQVYRDGGNLETVRKNYELVARLSKKFTDPAFIARVRREL